jgi:F-type H+-transporting ATPase subunit gamma
MARTQELKRRIKSTKKTRQITKTMEMVSTSKLKRASDRVYAARPFAEHLAQVISRLADPELRERYPLLRVPVTVKKAAVVLITSNRGLAGGFNANLIKEARNQVDRLRAAGAEVEIHGVGRKGISFLRFKKEALATARMDITDRPTLEDAASVIDPLRDRFEAGELDEVYGVYAQFRSALSTPPATMKVLPVEQTKADTEEEAKSKWVANYILSPSADEILNRILPLYVRNSVYRALVETAAAEHGARRTAMKSATDNAGDILDLLNRTYNRARQAAITQEIAEIIGGAAALE